MTTRKIKKKSVPLTEAQTWAKQLGVLDKKNRFTSEQWCLGGTICTGYSDPAEVLLADKRPTSFDAFDDLLLRICPQIAFLQYKKLYKACVTVETDVQHDYYGSNITYGVFVCDVEKLYSMLKEFGLLMENNND